MRSLTNLLILAMLLAAGLLVGAACQSVAPAQSSAPSATPAVVPLTPTPTSTEAGPAVRRARGGALAYTGDVRARQTVTVVSKVGGRVEQLNVDVGSPVKAGDVLAVLEHQALDAQVKQAEAGLAAAQANLAKLQSGPRQEQVAVASANLRAAQARLDLLKKTPFDDQTQTAQLNVDRAKNALWQAQSVRDATCANKDGVWQAVPGPTGMRGMLVAPGGNCTAAEAAVGQAEDGVSLAQTQLDQLKAGPRAQDVAQAEAAVSAAYQSLQLAKAPFTDNDIAAVQAQVDAAKAALEMARLNRDESSVKAPIDGIVAARLVSPGAMVSSALGGGGPIATLVSQDVQVVFGVEDSLYGRLKAGQPAQLSVAAYPDETFAGKVAIISPVADPTARTFEVTVYPDDPDHKLRPGMFADVSLEVAQ